jgi:hypothetical protein
MNAADLLAEFARRAQVPGLAFNEAGLARLQVDGTTVIDLESAPAAGQLHLYSTLGEAPRSGREAYFERLLALNLFCRATNGATLALDERTQEILLCRALQLDGTDYVSFETALTQLVDAVVVVRRALAETGGAAASTSATDTPPHWAMLRV